MTHSTSSTNNTGSNTELAMTKGQLLALLVALRDAVSSENFKVAQFYAEDVKILLTHLQGLDDARWGR